MKNTINKKTVLKGKEWSNYLKTNSTNNYLKAYVCTYNYTQIYKAGEYYFSFNIAKGYKNLSSLKKLV